MSSVPHSTVGTHSAFSHTLHCDLIIHLNSSCMYISMNILDTEQVKHCLSSLLCFWSLPPKANICLFSSCMLSFVQPDSAEQGGHSGGHLLQMASGLLLSDKHVLTSLKGV